MGLPANRISPIVAARQAVTAEAALRLERAFKMPAQFWLGLQQTYDLKTAQDTTGPLEQMEKSCSVPISPSTRACSSTAMIDPG